MANPFKAAMDKAESHPAIAAMIFGTIILVITLIISKRNSGNTSTTPIDPNTGLPLTNNGSYTLTPTNNSSDVLSAIGNLSQAFQNFVGTFNQSNGNNNTSNSGGTNTGGTTNPGSNGTAAPIGNGLPTTIISNGGPNDPTFGPGGAIRFTNPPVGSISAGAQIPIRTVNNQPSPTQQLPIPTLRQVSVAQWSATNTPWNSTLSGIANHFSESLAYVESVNPQITNPNLIYPGQKVNY